MLVALLALSAPSDAAEVQVALNTPITLLVDGVPMLWDEAANTAYTRDLPAGRHTVESRNMMGKTTAWKEIELAHNDQIRFEYRKKELWHIGTYKLAVAPPPPAPATTTTVVQSTTTTTAPVVGAGVGITVSDGVDTVSVSAGPRGAGVVVTDGYDTVTMNGGVQVTETTTTTVVTDGQAPPPPVPMVSAMDESSFGRLLQQLEDASFSDDKMAVLQSVVAHNWLTCDQLGRVLDTFAHGSDKLEAVQAARAAIIDPQNAYVLNDKFSFSSDAQKAQSYFR